jgi:hypothetical protein
MKLAALALATLAAASPVHFNGTDCVDDICCFGAAQPDLSHCPIWKPCWSIAFIGFVCLPSRPCDDGDGGPGGVITPGPFPHPTPFPPHPVPLPLPFEEDDHGHHGGRDHGEDGDDWDDDDDDDNQGEDDDGGFDDDGEHHHGGPH